jgi:hypothetical protein
MALPWHTRAPQHKLVALHAPPAGTHIVVDPTHTEVMLAGSD